MSSKRVSVLTFNSLSKVCSSPRFSKLLSTAAQTQSWDFRSSNTEEFSPSPSPPYTTHTYTHSHSQGFGHYLGSPTIAGGDNHNCSHHGDLGQRGTQDSSAGFHYHGEEETNGNLHHITPNPIYENTFEPEHSSSTSSKGFYQNYNGLHWESRGTTKHALQTNSASAPFGTGRAIAQNININSNVHHQNHLHLQSSSNSPEPRGSSLNENFSQNNYQFQQSQITPFGPNVSSQYQHKDSYNADSHGQGTNNPTSYGQLSATSNPEGESSSNAATLETLDEFCRKGNVKEALEVFGLMEKQGVHVDLPRILQLMKACGEANALQEAKTVHQHLITSFSPLKVSIYNRILEMYSKCGSMDVAFDVFQKMPSRNLTSWDTMITWLAKNGLGEDALDVFSQFKKAGLKPDGKMFIGVFSACGVVGDMNEGMLHFASMSSEYGIVPSVGHYVAVVDMLGSTGHLDEALEFIDKMPLEPTVDVWETLMNHCRVHGHLELGDRCAELVEQLDPSRLNEQSKVGLVPLKDSDLEKKKVVASQSPLEVRSKVHEYRAGDKSHPENDRLYALLRSLKEHMKEAGYIPETKFCLHDIDQESKEEHLLAHSERLALANGLLTTPARGLIRIMKNLRVCGDCHAAFKIASKIVGREIIMRDTKRFHHFSEGLCSCRDYW